MNKLQDDGTDLEDSGVDLPENGNEDTSSSKKKAT
jgi:hypothetical protein